MEKRTGLSGEQSRRLERAIDKFFNKMVETEVDGKMKAFRVTSIVPNDHDADVVMLELRDFLGKTIWVEEDQVRME